VINLAFADVHDLAEALREKHDNNGVTLEAYSLTCLSRISKAQRFSWWVTSLLHLFTMPSPFGRKWQVVEAESEFAVLDLWFERFKDRT
jgi:p-hydroxybenzoate 3-monooxygenase